MASLLRSATVPKITRSLSVDEIFSNEVLELGKPRDHYQRYWSWLRDQSQEVIDLARTEADLFFRRVGITFNVYGDAAGAERLIPFDLIPRIIPAQE